MFAASLEWHRMVSTKRSVKGTEDV